MCGKSWTRILRAILPAAAVCFLATASISAEEFGEGAEPAEAPAPLTVAQTADAETLFREGVDLFRQGKFGAAQQKLKAFLALRPRDELAARLVDEAGTRVMAKMAAEVRMGNEPTYVWRLYKKYMVRKLSDREQMQKMADRLVDPATSIDERTQLLLEFEQLGHYAMPVLVKHLGNQSHQDFQTHARVAIARIGSRAVLPLIAVLDHPDELVRQNAVLTLRDIRPLDARTVAPLKAMLENARETELTKRYAAMALEKIVGLREENLKTAADYYYEEANRYYLELAGVAEEADEIDGFLWHLNEKGELVTYNETQSGKPEAYPLWAWNEQRAEECVLRGMVLAKNQKDFYPLAACIAAAQYVEVKMLMDILQENPAHHRISVEERTTVENWDKKLVATRNLAAAVGKYSANEALHKTLRDMKKYPAHARLPGIGVFLSGIIARLDPEGELLPHPRPAADATVADQTVPRSEKVVGKDAGTAGVPTVAAAARPLTMNETLQKWDYAPLPMPGEGTEMQYWHGSALVAALDCEDATVQYAAAQALAAINRFPATWEGQEKVGAILGRGVSENQPIQVLLVVEDGSRPSRNNTSAEMRLRLEGLGFGVSIADSGRDAMIKARGFPPKDVIVVDNILRRNLTSTQLLEELKADPRTRYTPVGLLYDLQERTEVQARFGATIPLVAVESQGKDLREEIEKLNAQRPPESLPKRKAHETALACALALGALDPRWTHVRLQDAVPHCIRALTNRPDDLRVAAAIFLGRARGAGMKDAAAEALKAVALNRDNAVELRRSAIRSMGQIRPEADEEAYMALQSDDDQDVRFEASVVFGRFLRKNEKVVQFLLDNRIEKELKEK